MSKAEDKKAVAKKTPAKSYKLEGLVKGSHLFDGVKYQWVAGEIISCKTKKIFDAMKSLKSLKAR